LSLSGAPGAASPSYTGFLDAYSSAGATWGFSAYKLATAYAGNWGTVQRQSDNTTLAIGFDINNKANVSTFNTFCSGTNCYLTTLNDQVSGVNATQATLANMPRVIVDSNGVLAVCPQPGSKMATSYSATVNTAKVHMFAVARAAYADSRWSQAGLPTVTVTGNITSGSASIASMSSQVGISTANAIVNMGTNPGVTDSAGFLPNAPATGSVGSTNLSALPTGSTGTLAFAPGNLSPTGSQAGDTLTFTNAVLGGVWIMNGPASSSFATTAYWGVGMAVDNVAGDWNTGRNATSLLYQNALGNGMRGQWGVWDYDTFTTQLNYDGVSLGTISGSSANVTYSTNVGMSLFADANGAEGLSNTCFETMVLFNVNEGARVAMSNWLAAQAGTSFPFATVTSDGFAMTGLYQPNGSPSTSSVYGASSVGPDAWGMTWNVQSGGYTWPSVAYANNITNSTTMWRFIDEQGDSDINITAAERTEINNVLTVAPGQSFSAFEQIEFEQYTNQTGDWCYTMQIHYNDALSSAPDIVTAACKNNQLQFQYQKGSGPTTTNCGSPISLVQGTVYAVVVDGFWSTNHTSDMLTIHAGTNGGTLAQVCSVSGALWDNDTGAYLKAGIYRGFPWSNAGTLIERVMNMRFSTTANAFDAYITTQPALPAH
jgi:hypothetical protein